MSLLDTLNSNDLHLTCTRLAEHVLWSPVCVCPSVLKITCEPVDVVQAWWAWATGDFREVIQSWCLSDVRNFPLSLTLRDRFGILQCTLYSHWPECVVWPCFSVTHLHCDVHVCVPLADTIYNQHLSMYYLSWTWEIMCSIGCCLNMYKIHTNTFSEAL